MQSRLVFEVSRYDASYCIMSLASQDCLVARHRCDDVVRIPRKSNDRGVSLRRIHAQTWTIYRLLPN